MEQARLSLDNPVRQRHRDDRIFRRECMRYLMYGLRKMPCPCMDCNGKVTMKLKKVRAHLMRNGRHPRYRVWKGPGDYDSSDAEWESAARSQPMHPNRDEGMNLRPLIQNRFEREHVDIEDRVVDVILRTLDDVDDMNTDNEHLGDGNMDDGHQQRNPRGQFQGNDQPRPPGEHRDDETFDPAAMEEAIRDLYDGAPSTQLGATIFLKNLFSVHSTTSRFVEDLLAGLHKYFLPANNSLPKTKYGLTNLLGRFGLDFVNIDACIRGCVLFRKNKAGIDLSGLDHCPRCQEPRFRDMRRRLCPRKILRQFPVIPHLQRTYRSPSLSELQLWHEEHKSTDGKVRFPADCKAWKIAAKRLPRVFPELPDFHSDPKNVTLALSADGMTPFKLYRSSWSTTPVLLFNYNIPPWLATKKFFVILALLIPGKEACKDDSFDVYIEPLVEELLDLWEGVPAYNAHPDAMIRQFTLRAMVLWTIHDLPGYGMVAGTAHSGTIACPPCGPQMKGIWAHELGKFVYPFGRRWLEDDHPYRSVAAAKFFDGVEETRPRPTHVTAEAQLACAAEYEEWKQHGYRSKHDPPDPSKSHGMKRTSILFRLPYWKV